MSTLKVTHLQNESNSAPSISISSAVGGGVTFAGISTFHGAVKLEDGLHGNSTDTITASTNGSERLRINSVGEVGINNTSPENYSSDGRNLVIGNSSSNAASGISLVSGTGGYSTLYFADGTSGSELYSGTIVYNHSDNRMDFWTNGVKRLRITSAGLVGIGTDVLAASSRLTLFEESGNGQTLEIKAKNSGGVGSQPGIKFTAHNGDNIGGVYGDVNSDTLKLQTGGTDRVVISAAGISQFQATGRVATFTGNGIEINNSLGSNVFIGTQSGTEGKMGTVNNANMSLFTNNNYAKRAELQTSGSFSILDGDLIVANGHGINFGSTTPDGVGTVFSETLDDYEEGVWVPSNYTGASVSLYRGYYIKVGRQVTVWFSAALSSGTGSAFTVTLPFAGQTSGSTGTQQGVEAHGNCMLHGGNPPANTYNATVYCWNTVCSVYWNVDSTGWSQAAGNQLNGTVQFTATYVTA